MFQFGNLLAYSLRTVHLPPEPRPVLECDTAKSLL